MKKILSFTFVATVFITLLIISLSTSKPQLETLQVENIVMNEEYVVMSVGETKVLLASIYPFNANNQNIIWSTSDANLAAVENGIVNASSVGNVRITAKSEEGGFEDYCYIDIIS